MVLISPGIHRISDLTTTHDAFVFMNETCVMVKRQSTAAARSIKQPFPTLSTGSQVPWHLQIVCTVREADMADSPEVATLRTSHANTLRSVGITVHVSLQTGRLVP